MVSALATLMACSDWAMADPPYEATRAFNAYIATFEGRLAQQHSGAASFLAESQAGRLAKVRLGGLLVEQVTSPGGLNVPGAMLHHWRGTAFAPGAKVEEFERLLRDFDNYPTTFAPQVERARGKLAQGHPEQLWMRVRQHHVITVVMDSSYDVSFSRLDVRHGFSISRSTRIAEVGSPGTTGEKVLEGKEEHGFLWRQDTYWSYEERDGGLFIQVESVSLTRSVPVGLAWAVGPFVESVPRESLEFTLRSVCRALSQQKG